MNEYAVDKCFECDDFFTCDGQCDEVEDEPQTERSMAVGKRSDATADKYNLYGKTTTDEPQTIIMVKDHGRKQALEMIDLYHKLTDEQQTEGSE